MKALLLTPLLVLGFAVSAGAQALLLDFGPTTPTGSSLTNSPFHSATSDSGDTTWNVISSTSNTSGFSYSNGTAATGVTLQIGATIGTTSVSPTTVSFTSPSLTFSALGTAQKTGIYASPSVATDAVFANSGGASTYGSVGVQIGGLTAGTYTIYITAQNTNSTTNARQTLYANASSTSGDFDFSGYSSAFIAYNGTNSTSSWVQATSGNSNYGNYVALSVTLTAGQYLNIANVGSVGEDRGFLNSVEIVNTSAIPEPSTYAALAGLATLGLVIIRRRRSRAQ